MSSSSSSSSTKKTKCIDVVNPLAGGKRALELYNVVKDNGNVEVLELIITVGQMDAHDRLLARPNLLAECELLRVFGGDGLMNECVNAIAKLVGDDWSRASKLRFQIHRCGSSNAVHKHITDSLAAGKHDADGIVWLDVMRIDAKDGSFSRHAALHSGMALMADFDVLHEQKMRNVPVWAKDFLSPAIAIFQCYTRDLIVKFKPVLESEEDRSSLPYKYTEPPAQRDADGWCVIEDKFLLVGMLNMPWQSGDICMAPSSHSGSVDLTLLRVKPPGQSYEMTRFELLRLFSAMQDNGSHIKDKRIEYFCCKEIEITPREEQAATIDGEVHSVPKAGLHVSLFAKKIACVK